MMPTEFHSSQSDFDDSDDDDGCPIAETFSSEFLFDPQSDDPSNKHTQKCCMKVNVIEKIYSHEEGSPHWYYINYTYEFVGENSGKRAKMRHSYRHPSHPWWCRHNAEDEYLGTIIRKNEMIEKMIKYLVMPMNELEILCAPRCPQQYKRQVLHSIAMFW